MAIAMDMWPPYISSTLRHLPGARDKNKAVDEMRKREHREYRAQGDETLARSRYLWLYAQERMPHKHHERFEQLRAMNLKTGRAGRSRRACANSEKNPLGNRPSLTGSSGIA